jgi:hypothetical protein
MNSVFEHLQSATLRLAQAGSLKDRLSEAYQQHLSQLDAEQLPEPYRVEFVAMCTAMQRERPLPRENPARASVRKMSSDEANRYAALIVLVFGATASALASGRSPVRPAAASLAPVLQLFALEG